MIAFDKELALSLYTTLCGKRVDQVLNLPDYQQRLEERGSGGFYTDLDPNLWNLEATAHRNGFFFWHHFEDDPETGGEKSIYTLEEIKPTTTFDVAAAEVRFNEIERLITDQTPGDVLFPESEAIDHEAHRNGLSLEWDNATQRYICKPLPGYKP